MNATETKPFPDNLTPRQREVLEAYVIAGSYKGAGKLVGVGKTTAAAHLDVIRDKAGVQNGVQLVVKFIRATTPPAVMYVGDYRVEGQKP